MPIEFANYMHYVRSLRFEDRPDYSGIRKIFKKLLKKEGYEYDHLFDWVMIDQQHVGSNIFSVDSFDDIRMKDGTQKEANHESIDGNKDEEDK